MEALSRLLQRTARWGRRARVSPAAAAATDEAIPRARLAAHLRGDGIEIGPLASPLWLPPGTRVTYVDKFPWQRLCELNPDVPAEQIRHPELVCDTASLDPIPDASCDFVVACHLLEHAHDPIRALLAWHRVLRPGGLALCILPDARYTFDRGRQLTSLEHLLWDYENAGSELKRLSDLFHIAECNLNMHPTLDHASAVDLARRILDESYDTHFHVWTYQTFARQLEALIAEHGLPFAVRESACDETVEMLFLLEALPGTAGRLRPVDGHPGSTPSDRVGTPEGTDTDP